MQILESEVIKLLDGEVIPVDQILPKDGQMMSITMAIWEK